MKRKRNVQYLKRRDEMKTWYFRDDRALTFRPRFFTYQCFRNDRDSNVLVKVLFTQRCFRNDRGSNVFVNVLFTWWCFRDDRGTVRPRSELDWLHRRRAILGVIYSLFLLPSFACAETYFKRWIAAAIPTSMLKACSKCFETTLRTFRTRFGQVAALHGSSSAVSGKHASDTHAFIWKPLGLLSWRFLLNFLNVLDHFEQTFLERFRNDFIFALSFHTGCYHHGVFFHIGMSKMVSVNT